MIFAHDVSLLFPSAVVSRSESFLRLLLAARDFIAWFRSWVIHVRENCALVPPKYKDIVTQL